MMKNSFRRLLGLVLAVIMIVGALPVMAMAAGNGSVDILVVDTSNAPVEGVSVVLCKWDGSAWVPFENGTTNGSGIATISTAAVGSGDHIIAQLGTNENCEYHSATVLDSIVAHADPAGSTVLGDKFLTIASDTFAGAFSIIVNVTTPAPTPVADVVVNFVVEGAVIDTKTGKPGDALTYPANPTLENFEFTGWDTEIDVFPEDAVTTITALFTPIEAPEEEPTSGIGLFHVQVFDGTDYIPNVGVKLLVGDKVIGTGTTDETGLASITSEEVAIGTAITVALDSEDYEYMTGEEATSILPGADEEYETTTASGTSLTVVKLEDGKFCGAFAIFVKAAEPEETPDTTAPVISLTNNKTVCVGTEFTVTDDVEVAEVRVNSAVVTAKNGKFSVGEKIGTITIYAKDTAGNETTVTVKVAHHNWSAGVYSCSKYTCAHHNCPGLFKCNHKACTTKCYTSTCHDHARGYCYITYTCTRCSETKTDFYKHYSCYNHDHSVQPELNKKDHVAYVEGYGKGLFKPENDVTRAEVATILYRLMTTCTRDHYKTTDNDFYDVGATNWFNTAVSTLDHAGIITDSDNGWFRPNEAITRAELAVMLAQFSTAKYTGASTFKDVDNKHWAAREIAIVQDLGWIEGYPDNTFQPDDTLTRAEMVTMINRVLQRAVTEKGMLKNMNTFCDVTADKGYFEDVLEAANGHFYNRTKDKVSGQTYFYEDWTRLF